MKYLKIAKITTQFKSKLASLTYRICKGGELFDEIIARKRFGEHDASVILR